MKSGAEYIAEICTTFPARNIVMDNKYHPAYVDISVANCPQCGKRFAYHPSQHVYKRQHKHRQYNLCSWTCYKRFCESHKTTLDKRIEDCRKRLDYLNAQMALPPEEREIKSGLDRLIEYSEQRLSAALRKKSTKDEVNNA